MAFLKPLKHLLYRMDMFCSSELLRYNSETQYKTLTGGLLSLAIIAVIAGGFFNMVADTLNRVSITSSLVTTKQSNPPLFSLNPGRENMFMLGLSIQSIDLSFLADLNKGPQYFTLQMRTVQINYGVPTMTTAVLEPCRKEHWSMMPQFEAGFDSFGVGGWLCLPIGTSLPIQGTYSSPVNSLIYIEVYPCNNQTSNNTCASPQEIEALHSLHQNYYLSLNYINPVINPNQQNVINYYLESNDYVIFSSQIGSEAWVYFSDYTINTDDSIWPYAHNSQKKGFIVEQKAINHPYSVTQNTSFASVFLAKSVNSLVYNRQAQKISAVFSYIGGLVGAITALLFLMKSYTDSSLEVTIGINLFQFTKQDEQGNGRFSFMAFMRLTAYRILKFFGCGQTSQRAQRLQRFQREAVKQMDVQLLLKRLIKLESCMSRLFTAEQLEQIREGAPITLDSAKKMRTLLLREVESEPGRTARQVQIGNAKKENVPLQQKLPQQMSNSESITSIYKHVNINDEIKHKRSPVLKPQKHQNIAQETQNQMNLSELINKERQNRADDAQERTKKNRIRPDNHIILPPIQKKQEHVRFLPKVQQH